MHVVKYFTQILINRHIFRPINVMAESKDEDILYYIGEIGIKRVNRLSLKISEHEMVKIAKIVNATGLSIPKIIALISQPCCECGNDNIALIIPKGLLSVKKNNHGGNIISQTKNEQST